MHRFGSGFEDFENAEDRGSTENFDPDSGLYLYTFVATGNKSKRELEEKALPNWVLLKAGPRPGGPRPVARGPRPGGPRPASRPAAHLTVKVTDNLFGCRPENVSFARHFRWNHG